MEVDEEGRDVEDDEDGENKDGKGEEEEDMPDDMNLDKGEVCVCVCLRCVCDRASYVRCQVRCRGRSVFLRFVQDTAPCLLEDRAIEVTESRRVYPGMSCVRCVRGYFTGYCTKAAAQCLVPIACILRILSLLWPQYSSVPHDCTHHRTGPHWGRVYDRPKDSSPS